MPSQTNRGYLATDQQEFSKEQVGKLQAAQRDLVYLLDQGYGLEQAVRFVGDHFQFSARQRTAITRATAPTQPLQARMAKCQAGGLAGASVHIDTFNLVITLEAASSPKTVLLRCMDSTVRDLCGLRGTYRVLQSTAPALALVAAWLREQQVAQAVFYLDAPVSNSGRLRGLVQEILEQHGVPAQFHMVPDADACLWDKELVVSSDAIVLNRCASWVNLGALLVERHFPGRWAVDLSGTGETWHTNKAK